MGSATYDAGDILEKTAKNAECIQELIDCIVDLTPDHLRDYVEMLKTRLERRLFYQDYLYDIHGTFIERPKSVLEYKEYEDTIDKLTERL